MGTVFIIPTAARSPNVNGGIEKDPFMLKHAEELVDVMKEIQSRTPVERSGRAATFVAD
jgi:hypothetical protein